MTPRVPVPQIFNVYKPVGQSSFDIVRHFKRHLPRPLKKIGHFGTLDPFAEGVLLIGINGAQRLNDLVHKLCPKTYWAQGLIGIASDSGDATGKLTAVKAKPFTLKTLEQQIQKHYRGSYWQAPHRLSAAKFEGRPLYEWHRAGVHIHKEKVLRHLFAFEILGLNWPLLEFRVTVSAGTYIRSLFQELMVDLGNQGHLTQLKREAVGPIRWEQSLQKPEWPENGQEQAPPSVDLTELLPFPQLALGHEQELAIRHGQALGDPQLLASLSQEYCWLVNGEGNLLALGQREEEQQRVRTVVNFSAV